MKIISLVSSGRINGNTARVVALIEEHLIFLAQNSGVQLEIEKVFLAQQDIRVCKGCRVCFDKGEEVCPLKDDFMTIYNKVQEADGMILGSPVYVEDVNGIMKNWIDRMAFNCHRPAFAGKAAIVVTTSGVGSSNHAIHTMKTGMGTWGFKVVGQRKFRAGDLMSIEDMKVRHEKAIRQVGTALWQGLIKQKVKPSFYSLLAFKVQQSFWQKTVKYKNSMDYRYWEKQGWLKSSCNYYIVHNSSYIKTIVARGFGSIVAKFFI